MASRLVREVAWREFGRREGDLLDYGAEQAADLGFLFGAGDELPQDDADRAVRPPAGTGAPSGRRGNPP
ncbi:hypothetical protein ACU4GR_03825 [Methylobacterium oryzae CBMB20]